MVHLKILPCYPCPHNSVCCSSGVSLSEKEMEKILEIHGDEYIHWDFKEKEFRTRVVTGRCIFLKNNSCSIHNKEYYPAVCKDYPFRKVGTNLPYPYEIECPEF